MISCGSPEIEKEPKSEKPYFWKVEKEEKVSYLLGTIHIVVSLYELPCSDIILEQLKDSDLVFVEVVSNSDQEREESVDILSPKGKDFKHLNTYSQYFLNEKGVSSDLNCTGLNFAVESLCIMESLGVSSFDISMDEQVEFIARAHEIPLKSLDESDVVSQIEPAFTCELVEEKIEYYAQCTRDARDFFDSYRRGDLAFRTGDTDSDYDQFVLKQRNEQWISKFKSAHNNYDRVFMAAGAAHFIDAFNFIDMLESEGFLVERVSCQ